MNTFFAKLFAVAPMYIEFFSTLFFSKAGFEKEVKLDTLGLMIVFFENDVPLDDIPRLASIEHAGIDKMASLRISTQVVSRYSISIDKVYQTSKGRK